LARPIIEAPTMIVPNWQAMGRAIPGDAYIKNFGTDAQTIYRVLICGHAGKKRWAVTIFPGNALRIAKSLQNSGPKKRGAAQGARSSPIMPQAGV